MLVTSLIMFFLKSQFKIFLLRENFEKVSFLLSTFELHHRMLSHARLAKWELDEGFVSDLLAMNIGLLRKKVERREREREREQNRRKTRVVSTHLNRQG